MVDSPSIKFLFKKKFFIFFFIFFIIGLFVTKNYGVSSDEYSSRTKGFVTLNYLGDKFLPELNKSIRGNKNIPHLLTK